MKAYFLALIGGQLFGLRKESVAGIGTRDERKVKPLEENGKKLLPLPDGNFALICDLLPLLGGGEGGHARQSHYLIVTHQGQLIALVMSGKGRLVMMDASSPSPLPLAFNAQARELIPGVLINCTDLILLLDLDALATVPDRMASQNSYDQKVLLENGAGERDNDE